jgi:signal transduction histidine kinase
LRHSGATTVEVEIEYLPGRLRVVVRDNGKGFNHQLFRAAQASHWGLQGMRKRAREIGAQFRIWSRPGAGTEIEISMDGDLVDAASPCISEFSNLSGEAVA